LWQNQALLELGVRLMNLALAIDTERVNLLVGWIQSPAALPPATSALRPIS
jgi:hypothetical protein